LKAQQWPTLDIRDVSDQELRKAVDHAEVIIAVSRGNRTADEIYGKPFTEIDHCIIYGNSFLQSRVDSGIREMLVSPLGVILDFEGKTNEMSKLIAIVQDLKGQLTNDQMHAQFRARLAELKAQGRVLGELEKMMDPTVIESPPDCEPENEKSVA
jgi:hypothetical protein